MKANIEIGDHGFEDAAYRGRIAIHASACPVFYTRECDTEEDAEKIARKICDILIIKIEKVVKR